MNKPLDEVALKRTLPGRLALFARTRGDKPALRHKRRGIWQEITWAEYYQNVAAVGRMLREFGVQAGDHVAILSDNRPEWLYADLAAQAIGARSVGIYQTSPAADVAYIVNHSQSVVLFCEDQEQVDKYVQVAVQTPQLKRVVAFEPRGTRDYADTKLMSWQEFIRGGRALTAAEPEFIDRCIAELDPRAPAMVVYTSGTTGRPKGALLCSDNICPAVDSITALYEGSDRDLVLSYLPLCHVAEKIYSVFLPLSCGLVVHFGESIDTVQEDLREVSPTIFLGVPRIWEKMHAGLMIRMQNSSWLKKKLFFYFARRGQEIARRKQNGGVSAIDRLTWLLGDLLVYRPLQERLGLRRCRTPGSGAAPIARELLEWFHGVGVPILEGYGMTELAGGSHFNPPGRARIGTVGAALPVLEHKIAEDGEILVRGPSVFLGYLHNEEATRAMIDAEGWLHTGDVGEVDEAGYLKITGRKKDIIITAGGKNISPEKVENALKTSPFIKEAVAIGDRKKFMSALIQIEFDTVGDWAQRRNIAYTSYADLASKPEVVKLIDDEIKRLNELLAPVEQVRKFRILPKELHQDDGDVTATQKVRRSLMPAKFGGLIDSMYGGSSGG